MYREIYEHIMRCYCVSYCCTTAGKMWYILPERETNFRSPNLIKFHPTLGI